MQQQNSGGGGSSSSSSSANPSNGLIKGELSPLSYYIQRAAANPLFRKKICDSTPMSDFKPRVERRKKPDVGCQRYQTAKRRAPEVCWERVSEGDEEDEVYFIDDPSPEDAMCAVVDGGGGGGNADPDEEPEVEFIDDLGDIPPGGGKMQRIPRSTSTSCSPTRMMSSTVGGAKSVGKVQTVKRGGKLTEFFVDKSRGGGRDPASEPQSSESALSFLSLN